MKENITLKNSSAMTSLDKWAIASIIGFVLIIIVNYYFPKFIANSPENMFIARLTFFIYFGILSIMKYCHGIKNAKNGIDIDLTTMTCIFISVVNGGAILNGYAIKLGEAVGVTH